MEVLAPTATATAAGAVKAEPADAEVAATALKVAVGTASATNGANADAEPASETRPRPSPAPPAAAKPANVKLAAPFRQPVLAVPAFGPLRRVDDAYGDAILIEDYVQGGASVVHVFPEALDPSATLEQRRQFAKIWCGPLLSTGCLGGAGCNGV